jgi:hypothetical protein
MPADFFVISVASLNLFSFVLGMLYTLANVTWANPRKLWLQVVLYFIVVAFYFYLQTKL